MPSSTVVPVVGGEEPPSAVATAHPTPGGAHAAVDGEAATGEAARTDLEDGTGGLDGLGGLDDLTDDEQGAAEWDSDDPDEINMVGLEGVLTRKPSMCQRLCCVCNCCCCSKSGAVPPSKACCNARPIRGVRGCARRALSRADEIFVDILYGSVRTKAELALSWLAFKAQSLRNALPNWWDNVWYHPHTGIPARFRACKTSCWKCGVYCVQACKNWRRESSYRHGSGTW